MKLNKILLTFVLLVFISSSSILSQEKSLPNIGVWIMSNYTHDDTENLTNNSGFNVKHARLLLKGNGAENWGYHLMGEMYGPKDGKPVLMQAWVSYKVNSLLKFRFGQFKYPFGYEAIPGRIYWKFLNPSYVISGVAKKLGMDGSLFRDIGLEAAGEYAFSKSLTGIYKLMIFNGTGANIGDYNNAKDYVVFAGVKLPMNVTLGGSYYAGKSGLDEDEVDESAFGLLFKLTNKRYTAQAEYISANYELSGSDTETLPSGFYASGTFKVTPAFEVGARYDAYEKNSNVENTNQSRFTLMAGYYLNKINRVVLNYEIRENDQNKDLGNLLTVQLQAAL